MRLTGFLALGALSALTFPTNDTAFTQGTLPAGALILHAQGQKAGIAVLPYAQGRDSFFARAEVLKKSNAATLTK